MKGIFIDIETTGLNHQSHVPIEIALIAADMSDGTINSIYNTYINCSDYEWSQASKEALEVNGIVREDVLDAPNRFEVMNQVDQFLKKNNLFKSKAVFVCHNSSFDRIFFSQIIPEDHIKNLNFPYHWLDLPSMYWMRYYYNSSFRDNISFSKDNIARSLGLPPESHPHRAFNGAKHLLECYTSLKKSQVIVDLKPR